jgi:hypothetical protein
MERACWLTADWVMALSLAALRETLVVHQVAEDLQVLDVHGGKVLDY